MRVLSNYACVAAVAKEGMRRINNWWRQPHLQAFIGSEEHAQVFVFLDRALLEKQAIAPETKVVDELFLQLACELDEIRHLLLHLLDLIY